MNLQILGCAGGIGGRERFTTCLRVDEDILLDTGTGLTSLDITELVAIDHVFLTHGHLDHVAGLALLVDAVRGKRSGPVTVHATDEVTAMLKKSLFNWALWPDFTTIPSVEDPTMRWETMAHGTTIDIGGRSITSHSVNHTAGSSAYWVHQQEAGFLFTGDMSSTPELWTAFAQEKKLSKVIVDCSFPNAESDIAALSMHFCPRTLIEEIKDMPDAIEFLIYHLKPGQEDLIMHELTSTGGTREFRALKCGERFEF
jgi:cAMP phosphodiesterase